MPTNAHKTIRTDAGHTRPPRRVGLLAGWGRYPLVVAESLRRQGIEVYALGVSGHAEPTLAAACDHFEWVGLCKLGRAIRYFQRYGVTEATMAGKIHKTVLFQPWRWLKHLPDLTTVRTFLPHFVTRHKDCRDDTLLGALVELFAAHGIRFGPATDYAPELLVDEGVLSRLGPSAAQWRDVEFGWDVAKRMGDLDIGQSVAIKDQAVLAVEAIEGTDLCIRRAGELCRAGGFTVVKVAKPRQDMRYDVPTVGLRTLKTLVEAGGRVLAVEAKRTVVLEQPEFVEFANRNGLVVVSMVHPETSARGRETPAPSADNPLEPAALLRQPQDSESRR